MAWSVEMRLRKSLLHRRYIDDAAHFPDEIWRDVPDWPDYWISNLGRLRDVTGRILRFELNGRHPFVQLWHPDRRLNCQVATIVLLAFVGPSPPERRLALHIDDDPNNNVLTNLYWGSRSDNYYDAVRNGKLDNSDPERCAKISASKKGKWIGGVADNQGRICVTDGICERRLPPGSDIPDGWQRGRAPGVLEKNWATRRASKDA